MRQPLPDHAGRAGSSPHFGASGSLRACRLLLPNTTKPQSTTRPVLSVILKRAVDHKQWLWNRNAKHGAHAKGVKRLACLARGYADGRAAVSPRREGGDVSFHEDIGGNAVAPSMYSWARRTSFPPNFASFAFPRSGLIRLTHLVWGLFFTTHCMTAHCIIFQIPTALFRIIVRMFPPRDS